MDLIPSDNNTLNLLALDFIKLISLYMILPMLGTGLVLKLLKVNGKVIGFLIGVVGLIGLYFLAMSLK